MPLDLDPVGGHLDSIHFLPDRSYHSPTEALGQPLT